MHNRQLSMSLLLGLGLVSFPSVIVAAVPASATQAAPADAQAKPPTELDLTKAALAETQAKLDRQTVIADNARAQLRQVRNQGKLKDELLTLAQQRNAELLAIGREVLDRYAHKGLFSVVAGAEPYVQASRVRMENLVQDYEDKLRAAKFTADTLPPSVEARMKAELAPAPGPAPTPAN